MSDNLFYINLVYYNILKNGMGKKLGSELLKPIVVQVAIN
jgi:hypothetical protein